MTDAARIISPVGNAATLAPDGFWLAVADYPDYYHPPQKWRSVNDYGNYYPLTTTRNPDGTVTYSNYAYHTGADLNLTMIGNSDADAHAPVVALAGGVVTDASRFPEPSTWGNLVVVRSELADGTKFWTRYAHMDALHVKAGDVIQQGASLGLVGNSFGRFPYHLHLDISLSGKLDTKPGDWPGLDRVRLKTDYVDPLMFVRTHVNDIAGGVTVTPVPPPVRPTVTKVVNTTNGYRINLRASQSATGTIVGSLTSGMHVDIYTDNIANGYAETTLKVGGVTDYVSTYWLADLPAPAVVTDTIIDLSSDNVISDPVAFKAWLVANKITILHRATWGDGSDNWVDQLFQPRRAEYGALCTFGAYHQFNGDDPIKQADNFINVVKPDGKTPLALDVELASAVPANAVLCEARIIARTGKPPLTYTRESFWGDAPAGSGPLWVATQRTPPVLPSKYTTWAIQQHAQTTVPGVTGVVDRDQFNGTPEQLAAFWPSVSGVVVERTTAIRYVKVDEGLTLNVRNAPGTNGAVVGSFPRGTMVVIYTDQTLNGYAELNIPVNSPGPDYVAVAYLQEQPIIPTPVKRGSLFGVHTEVHGQWILPWMADLNRQGHPLAGVTVLLNTQEGKDAVQSAQVKAVSPKTIVCERWYWEGQGSPVPLPDWNKPDLRAEGDNFCTAYIQKYNPSRAADYLVIINEPSYGPGTPTWIMGACDAAERNGFKLAVPAFSNGNPPLPNETPRPNHDFWTWGSTHVMLKRLIDGNHALGIHMYAYPERVGAWDVDMMRRTEDIHDLIPDDVKQVKMIVLEYGMGEASAASREYFMDGVKAGYAFLRNGKANVIVAMLWCAGDWQDHQGAPNSNIYQWKDDLTPFALSQ